MTDIRSIQFYRAISLGVGILWAVCAGASAQSAPTENAEYLIDAWETEQGLPENSATAMVQTPDGYLWFGTFSGLVRFDGVSFKVFDSSNTPQLPSSAIINLHLDATGRLWVSTYHGLVSRLGQEWTAHDLKADSPADFVRSFSENAGVLSIACLNGRVFRAEGGHLTELPQPPGGREWGHLGHVDRTGRIWLAHRSFFGSWDGQHWQPSPLQSSLTNQFRGAGNSRNGHCLVLSGDSLFRIDQGQLLSQLKLSESIEDIWRVDEDSEGIVWASSASRGLYAISPTGAVKRYSTTNGLTYNSLRFVFEDREHNLWVGTSGGGLLRFKRPNFVNYGLKHGLPERNIKAVAEEAPGRLIVGTHGMGLARLENGRATQVIEQNQEPLARYVQSLFVDRQGRIWSGTLHEGVQLLAGDRQQRVSIPDLGRREHPTVFGDSQGRIWVSGNQSLAVFEAGQLAAHPPNPGAQPQDVRYFAENPLDKSIWAASSAGLFQFEAGQWKEIKSAENTSVPGILCLRFEPDGTLWAGGAGVGLLRWQRGQWSQVTEANGLASRSITAILDDDLGFWWLASNRGVMRAAHQDIRRVADGKMATLACQVFNQSDGMASAECSRAFQSTALKDSQGRLWFGTIKGLAMVDPAKLQLNTNPPPVVIDWIKYQDSSGKVTELPPLSQSRIELPPGTRKVEFKWSGLSFSAPEKMRFAYEIKTANDQWGETTTRRNLYVHTPEPTQIRLQVKAANNDGVWNHTGATVTVVIQPFLWQTLWFRALVLAGLIAGTGLIVWSAARTRLQRRIERLEQERALEEGRVRLAKVLEASSDFVGFADQNARALFLNAAGRSLVGLNQEEDISGWPITDFYPAWAGELVMKEGLPTAIREGTWRGETALSHPDGHEIPISQVIITHRGPTGAVEWVSTVARDITERKQMEAALRASETLLRQFILHTPAAVAMFDLEMRYLSVSDRWMIDYHLHGQDIIGRFHYDVFPDLSEESKAVLQRVLGGAVERCEHDLFERADGTVEWLQWEARPWREAGGEIGGAIIFSQVVTERKKAEERIKQQLDELRRWHRVMLDREDRHQQFKREVNELCRQLGQPIRYPSQTSAAQAPQPTEIAPQHVSPAEREP